ncbi:MAG: hypothetical protein ACFFAN_02525 [Promethearchaeota archaeon]
MELVEKYKIHDDKEFVKWTEFGGIPSDLSNIEVYIEKKILPELEQKDFILIDLAIGELKGGEKIAMLFIKKENDVYG